MELFGSRTATISSRGSAKSSSGHSVSLPGSPGLAPFVFVGSVILNETEYPVHCRVRELFAELQITLLEKRGFSLAL